MGNKLDTVTQPKESMLENQDRPVRFVSFHEGEKLAKDNGWEFIEASAVEDKNTVSTLEKLLVNILTYRENK